MRRREGVVTWSPSVTLVPTHVCFNACDYCSFRQPPTAIAGDGLSDQQATHVLLHRPWAREVLLLSGEVSPQSADRPAWFRRLLRLSRLALQHGRLPHTNAGPLSRREMAALARLNPSLGLMLEGLGPAYDAVHRRAPSKTLAMRIGQIEQAGRLGIPFTTGLLLGLGETLQQRREALELLALLQRQWGHIQEVILQPWQPAEPSSLGQAQARELLQTIAEAREILPAEVHLQLPPNLWPASLLVAALDAGIDDLGGIDHVDVINPAHPQPCPQALWAQLAAAGWQLKPRLCVHGAWIDGLPLGLRRRAQQLLAELAC